MIDPGLKGKTAIVTGANNPWGIGAKVATALASQGVNILLHYYRHGVDLHVSGLQHRIASAVLFFAKSTASKVNTQ